MKPIYIVLSVNLLIWAGIFSYLLHLESRLRRLEKQ